MNYSSVLFDLDGTLLDTLDDLADSMNNALTARNLPAHPTEAYKIFVGDGVETLTRRALGDAYEDKLAAAVLADMKAQYAKLWDNKTKPYDGICDMLAALSQKGVKLSVLSNKPHNFTKLCVERFLGDFSFDVVQGVSETCLPKPDPSGALVVAETLATSPENFAYLGDTNTDMKTANAAGMFAIGVTWGFRSAEELRKNGAKALINHPSELLEIIG
ncbi:MAG: HAD family hydrolase [Phycisphaerae bacterium]|nr:HAD family hydrolase [Phycisphaerae bacterium]